MLKNNHPLVSIIILTHNTLKTTSECLSSLNNVSYKNLEIIVVDNGSTDNTSSYIKKHFPKIGVIRNNSNLGFAEGNNIGFQKAKGELILFLNNDTIVERDFLTPLMDKIVSDKTIGGVQPKILNYSKKNVIDSVGSYFITSGFLYHFGHNKKDQEKYNIEEEIFSMKGACMLFKREVLQKVGVFDKDYFAYFEETDLCQRVWLSGYRLLYIPTSSIYHIGGATAKKFPSAAMHYHSYKNRIYTYLKNLEPYSLIKVMPGHILLCVVVAMAFLLTGKISLVVAIIRAIFWNIVNINKTLKIRKKIKNLRKMKDEEYLPRVSRNVRLSYYYHLFATELTGYAD